MKYKELLEKLQELSPAQLELDAIFSQEERAWRISKLDVIENPVYYDPENPEDGCFELSLGDDPDDYELAYDYGYPLLTD